MSEKISGLVQATKEDYTMWMEGYLEKGGKITNSYNYPFKNAEGNFFMTNGNCSIPPLTGANSVNVIVREQDEVEIVGGGASHNNLYFMKNFYAIGLFVPIYQDIATQLAERLMDKQRISYHSLIKKHILDFIPSGLKNMPSVKKKGLLSFGKISPFDLLVSAVEKNYICYLCCTGLYLIEFYKDKDKDFLTNFAQKIEELIFDEDIKYEIIQKMRYREADDRSLEQIKENIIQKRNEILSLELRNILIGSKCLKRAKKENYEEWMKGYLENGGETTHSYNYPFKNAEEIFFITNGNCSIPPLAGANSINVIVREQDEVEILSGGASHNSLYFMENFYTRGIFVPVYNDLSNIRIKS